jgi:hypothetical protein
LEIRTEIKFKFVQQFFINYSTEMDPNARALFDKGLRSKEEKEEEEEEEED